MRQSVAIALLVVFGTLGSRPACAQSATDSVTQTLRGLFDAMQSADTAKARARFLDGARVIPVADQSADTSVGGLTVDAFVAFVAKTAPSPWIERMIDPEIRVSGGVALAWFRYDVHRGSTLSQCGTNAVTLRRTSGGWRIVTMAFTSGPPASCATR